VEVLVVAEVLEEVVWADGHWGQEMGVLDTHRGVVQDNKESHMVAAVEIMVVGVVVVAVAVTDLDKVMGLDGVEKVAYVVAIGAQGMGLKQDVEVVVAEFEGTERAAYVGEAEVVVGI
jgi:hypothetical protein